MTNKIHITMITQPSLLSLRSNTTRCPVRGGFVGTLIKGEPRQRHITGPVDREGTKTTLTYFVVLFCCCFVVFFVVVVVVFCFVFLLFLLSIFVQNRRVEGTPNTDAKAAILAMTSLIQVFCNLRKLRVCGYHQVV